AKGGPDGSDHPAVHHVRAGASRARRAARGRGGARGRADAHGADRDAHRRAGRGRDRRAPPACRSRAPRARGRTRLKGGAMNRALLEKPFEPGQIRQRRGPYGPLDYVEGHSVIARLNEALEGTWSFEIVQHEVHGDEVVVLGKLTAETIVKMNFGVSQITRKEGGAVVSLGDDLKAAATDAMKK